MRHSNPEGASKTGVLSPASISHKGVFGYCEEEYQDEEGIKMAIEKSSLRLIDINDKLSDCRVQALEGVV